MKAEYTSPYTIGKRQTVYIDVNDPRVRNPIKYGITAARLGSEFVVVTDATTTPVGKLSSVAGSGGPSYTSKPDKFIPSSTNFIKPAIISNLDADWSDTTLVITFDFDFTNDKNKYVQGFKYRLTSGSTVGLYRDHSSNLNKSGIAQTINYTPDINERDFGDFATSFSLLEIYPYDSFGNAGDIVELSVIPPYVSDLPAPIITVTAINQGYTVDWESIPEKYTYIAIEEIISNASTAPSSGYNIIYLDNIKPATIITSNTQSRWVRARFTNRAGYGSLYSTAYKVTPESPVVVDNTPPNAPATGSVTAGVDNSAGATIGFNAYIDISWSAVLDSTLKGYRIRFRENGTSNPYSYVDSPGTGTTLRLNGLAIGTVYEIAVASYDEFNNTSSSYTSLGTAQATGTPFIGKNVTTVGYFGASATGDTGTFKFGYGVQDSGGVKRGLVFNSNNYWYIDSAQSATFKLGGDASNYIQWDGSQFIVQGDLRARAGNFQGNVQIISGGSIYSGTLSGNNLSGAGFILNNSGLTFNSSSVNGITTINGTNGLFTTSSANIGGWLISTSENPNSIYKTFGIAPNANTIKLDSSDGSISVSTATTTAGIGIPDSNNIVFWAGGTRSTNASFYVTKDGILNAKGMILTDGSITVGSIPNQIKIGATVAPSNLGQGSQDGIYINSYNYWLTNSHFSIGDSSNFIQWNDTTNILNVKSSKIFLNVSYNNDSTFGDPTVVQSPANGELTLGRAFFFGGTTNPNTGNSGGVITTRAQYNNGSQGTAAFNPGDIWLQRA